MGDAKRVKGLAAACVGASLALAGTTSVAQGRAPVTPESDTFVRVFWFGLRGYALSRDFSSAPFGTCGGPSCAPAETLARGADLGLRRRVLAGFELTGGVSLHPLYARVGLAVAWDLDGTASARVAAGRTGGVLSTTGITSVVTLAAGLRPRFRGGAATVGLFLAYVSPTARFAVAGDTQPASAPVLSWGLEGGFERRISRAVALAATLRVAWDLSVAGLVGVSFGSDLR